MRPLRRKRATRQRRIGAGERRAAFRPPSAAPLLSIIVKRLEKFQARILETILSRWEENHEVFSGILPGHRHDAYSTYARKALGDLDVDIEELFDPGDLSGELEFAAAGISKQGLLQFKRLINISNHTDAGVSAAINVFRERNVALIRSIPGRLLQDVSGIVDQAERGAWRVEELRKEIMGRFGVSRSRADLIARDQTLKLSGNLQRLRQTNAGIEEYIWTTSDDERVRSVHADLEGTKHRWDDPPVTNPEGDTNNPGEDYQCRCTAYPVIPALDDDEPADNE